MDQLTADEIVVHIQVLTGIAGIIMYLHAPHCVCEYYNASYQSKMKYRYYMAFSGIKRC